MTCPDLDRLLDFADARASALGLAGHVESCEECSLAVRILRESATAFYPELEVPDHLVEPVVAAAEALPRPPVRTDRDVRKDAWTTAGLATATAFAAVVVTGAFGPGTNVMDFVLLALASGPAAYWFERAAGASEVLRAG